LSRRRHEPEEHENHERWLVSYADFITLLFAFFVVMYVVSRVDTQRLNQVVRGIRWALHFKGEGSGDGFSILPASAPKGTMLGEESSPGGDNTDIRKEVQSLRNRIESRLRGFIMERKRPWHAVVMHTEGHRLVIRLAAAHFFDPAQAAIRPDMLPILDVVAGEVGAFGWPIRVGGHTDGEPLDRSRFRDNWELSASRAASVVRYLEETHRIPGAHLTAAGFGATRPIADNGTPEGRDANRRIELIVEVEPNHPLRAAAQ
jgi:chemotaxis protein MotB